MDGELDDNNNYEHLHRRKKVRKKKIRAQPISEPTEVIITASLSPTDTNTGRQEQPTTPRKRVRKKKIKSQSTDSTGPPSQPYSQQLATAKCSDPAIKEAVLIAPRSYEERSGVPPRSKSLVDLPKLYVRQVHGVPPRSKDFTRPPSQPYTHQPASAKRSDPAIKGTVLIAPRRYEERSGVPRLRSNDFTRPPSQPYTHQPATAKRSDPAIKEAVLIAPRSYEERSGVPPRSKESTRPRTQPYTHQLTTAKRSDPGIKEAVLIAPRSFEERSGVPPRSKYYTRPPSQPDTHQLTTAKRSDPAIKEAVLIAPRSFEERSGEPPRSKHYTRPPSQPDTHQLTTAKRSDPAIKEAVLIAPRSFEERSGVPPRSKYYTRPPSQPDTHQLTTAKRSDPAIKEAVLIAPRSYEERSGEPPRSKDFTRTPSQPYTHQPATAKRSAPAIQGAHEEPFRVQLVHNKAYPGFGRRVQCPPKIYHYDFARPDADDTTIPHHSSSSSSSDLASSARELSHDLPKLYVRRVHGSDGEALHPIVQMVKCENLKYRTKNPLRLFNTTLLRTAVRVVQPAVKICNILKTPTVTRPPLVWVGKLAQELGQVQKWSEVGKTGSKMAYTPIKTIGPSITPTATRPPLVWFGKPAQEMGQVQKWSDVGKTGSKMAYTPIKTIGTSMKQETKPERNRRILTNVLKQYPPKIYHYDFARPDADDTTIPHSSETTDKSPPRPIVGIVKRLADTLASQSDNAKDVSHKIRELQQRENKKAVDNAMELTVSDSFESMLSSYDKICSSLYDIVGPEKYSEMESEISSSILSSSIQPLKAPQSDRPSRTVQRASKAISWKRGTDPRRSSTKKVRIAEPEKEVRIYDRYDSQLDEDQPTVTEEPEVTSATVTDVDMESSEIADESTESSRVADSSTDQTAISVELSTSGQISDKSSPGVAIQVGSQLHKEARHGEDEDECVWIDRRTQFAEMRKGSDDSLNIENELPLDPDTETTWPDNTETTDHSGLLDVAHIEAHEQFSAWSHSLDDEDDVNSIVEVPKVLWQTDLRLARRDIESDPLFADVSHIEAHDQFSTWSHSLDDEDDVNSIVEVPKVLWQTDLRLARQDIESDPLFADVSPERRKQYLNLLLGSHIEKAKTLCHVTVDTAEDHVGTFDNVRKINTLNWCRIETQRGYRLFSAENVEKSNLVPTPVVDEVDFCFQSHHFCFQSHQIYDFNVYRWTANLKEAEIKIPHSETVSIFPMDRLGQCRHIAASNSQVIHTKFFNVSFVIPIKTRTAINVLVLVARQNTTYCQDTRQSFCSVQSVYAKIECTTPTEQVLVSFDKAEYSIHEEDHHLCEQDVREWDVYENPLPEPKKLKRFHPRVKQEIRQMTMPPYRSAEPLYERVGSGILPIILKGGHLSIDVFITTHELIRRMSAASIHSALSEDGSDNEDDGGLSVQVDDIDGVEDSNVEEETDTDDKDMFGTSSLVTVHDEQHTTMRKRSSHATKHKKTVSSAKVAPTLSSHLPQASSPWSIMSHIAAAPEQPDPSTKHSKNALQPPAAKRKRRGKRRKSKDATSNLWSVDWSKGGPALASNETKIPPMPKIHDQPEIDTHASSHASKASHQSHRSPPGEGSSGSSQGTTRTSLHADQAAATRKLSRNLDVSSNKDSPVRKSSKNIDPPTDADLKRGKRSVNVIAAQDRKLLG